MERKIPEEELADFLTSFVSEKRIEKFKQVMNFRTRHLAIVLEDIYQAHNASAVLRSCDCFGIQDVHIIENKNTYKVNPDVALGSSKWLTLQKYTNHTDNTAACLNELKKKGYRIIATSPHKSGTPLEQLDVSQKTALVFGTELTGISGAVVTMADEFLTIPMFGFTESFNISVSAALCLHTLVTKIHSNVPGWGLTHKEKNQVLLQWLRNSIHKPELIEEEYHKRKIV